MSTPTSLHCVITACKRPANVLCYCCEENLCRNHYNEHDYLNSKLTLLADQIETFDRQLITADLKKYISHSNDRIQQWRAEAYQAIDNYCEEKYREIETFLMKVVNQKRQNVEQIRKTMLQLVEKRQMTLEMIEELTLALRAVENEMKDIDQKSISIQTSSILLDPNLIRIQPLTGDELDLSALAPVSRTIDYARQGLYPIASDSQHVLVHREPNICLLDRNFKFVKQAIWTHGQIFDMCWSTALERFFLLTLKEIFIIDPTSMSIERVETTQQVNWLSCTASNTSLFLSTNEKGSAICEFNLLNSFQTAKRWDSPETCGKDERIHDIFYNKGTLLLLVENPQVDRIRVELRSSARLDRLWTLQLDVPFQSKVISCALLPYDQWLIVDGNTSRLFQITSDGKLKSSCYYNPIPCCACLFADQVLAISTIQGLHFHQL